MEGNLFKGKGLYVSNFDGNKCECTVKVFVQNKYNLNDCYYPKQ